MTTIKPSDIVYTTFQPRHFHQVISLGNQVHGDNYLSPTTLQDIYNKGWKDGINCSFVALLNNKIVGFRLTYAPEQWHSDKWVTPSLWPASKSQMAYFKCNTVAPEMQGLGIGSQLLKYSVEKSKKQGAKAGLAHIWLASPGNSAYKYFTKNGGTLVKVHPNKWQGLALYEGYVCPVCPGICECAAGEMMLTID